MFTYISVASVLSREQEKARALELRALKESNAKLKEELTMTVKKCKDLKERLREVGASALIIKRMIQQSSAVHLKLCVVFAT